MRDDLGNRMKQYEAVSSGQLLRRCPVIVRVDGRAFHTWTRGLDRPFDLRLINWMRQATESTAVRMQGCKLAFTQSDEASFLLTDYDNLETQPWFGYDLAKVVSLSASLFTGVFNREHLFAPIAGGPGLAEFDARAFNVPADDVANYFLWRAKDWRRNAIQMAAQSMFSPKELHGVKLDAVQEMVKAKTGVAWNEVLPSTIERGSWFLPQHLEWIEGPELNFAAVSEVVELALRPTMSDCVHALSGIEDLVGTVSPTCCDIQHSKHEKCANCGKWIPWHDFPSRKAAVNAASDVPGEQTADPEEAFGGCNWDLLPPAEGAAALAQDAALVEQFQRRVIDDPELGVEPEPAPLSGEIVELAQALKDSLRVAAQETRCRDELAKERARRYTHEDGTPK